MQNRHFIWLNLPVAAHTWATHSAGEVTLEEFFDRLMSHEAAHLAQYLSPEGRAQAERDYTIKRSAVPASMLGVATGEFIVMSTFMKGKKTLTRREFLYYLVGASFLFVSSVSTGVYVGSKIQEMTKTEREAKEGERENIFRGCFSARFVS